MSQKTGRIHRAIFFLMSKSPFSTAMVLNSGCALESSGSFKKYRCQGSICKDSYCGSFQSSPSDFMWNWAQELLPHSIFAFRNEDSSPLECSAGSYNSASPPPRAHVARLKGCFPCPAKSALKETTLTEVYLAISEHGLEQIVGFG